MFQRKMISGYKLKRRLADIVYPNRCPFCGEFIVHNAYYCPDCPVGAEFACDCSPPENIDEIVAVFEYNQEISPFVYALKDHSDGYAISAAAKLISDRARLLPEFALITCIPTDRVRMRQRGYNPPSLIAGEMSQLLGVPCNTKLLIKTRQTEIQKSLSAKERRINLEGAFRVNPQYSGNLPQSVLLTDDVYTTGATLSEAAQILREAGVERVCAAVIAMVSSPD
jgi:ComF family protein